MAAAALAAGGVAAAQASGQVSPQATEADNTIVAWGGTARVLVDGEFVVVPIEQVELIAPEGDPFVDVAVGDGSAVLGLTESGQVIAAGTGDVVDYLPSELESRTITSLGAHGLVAWAVDSEGEPYVWGDLTNAVLNMPELSDVAKLDLEVQIGAVVFADGSVQVWGNVLPGLPDDVLHVPAEVTDIVDISLGAQGALAVGADGTPYVWGRDSQYIMPDSLEGRQVTKAVDGNFIDTAGTIHRVPIANNASLPAEYAGESFVDLAQGSGGVRVAAVNDQGQLRRSARVDTPPAEVDQSFVTAVAGFNQRFAVIMTERAEPEGPQVLAEASVEGDPVYVVVDEEITGVPAEFSEGYLGNPAVNWFAYDDEAAGEQEDGSIEQGAPAGITVEFTGAEELVGSWVRFRSMAVYLPGGNMIQLPSYSEPVAVVAPLDVLEGSVPQISGDALVGSTLSATAAEFNDESFATVTGQWYRDGEAIADATGSTYELVRDDVGATISYVSTATRGEGELLEEVTSEPSNELGPVTLPPLEINGLPVIDGNPFIGQELSVTAADVNDDEVEPAFQWYVGGESLPDATGTTFEVLADYAGQTITVVQIAARDDATEPGADYAEAESEPTIAVREAPVDLEVETEAELSGPRIVGQTLTGVPATFTDASEDVVVTNYWVIDGETVRADETELVLDSEHIGASIRFRSVAEREIDDASFTSTSEADIGPVLAELAVDSEASISGTAEAGETLTATPGTFLDEEDLAEVSHTWLVDGEPVAHEGLTFVLGAEYEGVVIGYRSTATRTVDGIEESESSEAFSAEVTLPDDDEDGGDEGSPTRPGDDDEASRCVVASPNTLAAGSAHQVTVDLSDCGDWAGQEVRVWLFSDPINLGTATVGADGTFTVTIGADAPAGAHLLSVYDTEGNLIGYADITLTDGAGTGGVGGLPATGYDGSLQSLLIAVLLVLAGGIALVAARMRRELRA